MVETAKLTMRAKLDPVLEKQGFHFEEEKQEEKGLALVYANAEKLSYSVLYNEGNKQFELRSATLPEEKDAEITWRVLNSWLFDPQQDDTRAAESIANDFIETIEGSKRVEALQMAKKRRSKDEESSQDPMFFVNRLCGMMPALKEDLVDERSKYGVMRPIAFVETYVIPRVNELFRTGSKANSAKLAETLNDLYENADMDVRSIITMVLLNNLDDRDVQEYLFPDFTEELQKAYKAGRKIKNKKVKPEKVQKQSKIVAKALENNQGK